jgi:exonuclease SbcC
MRPLELTMRGFRSFRDEVTFDFRGRHLIGIVGPIGAGKSTILDAMAFALYGRTPRVNRETRSLINQLRDAAHVQLSFEVDGVAWRVTRALKRKGQGQVKLERLVDDEPAETIVMDKPVRERIERLLGMDFDTFGRSVLLAQNRFAEFLLATDAPRNAVLKGVFGYERFDAALAITKQRVAAAQATVAALDAEGMRAVEARAALADAQSTAAAAIGARDRLQALLPKIRELDDALADAGASAERATALAQRVRRAAERAPLPDEVGGAIAATSEAATSVDAAAAAVESATAALADAEAVRTAAAEAVGDLQVFADLVAQHRLQAEAVTIARAGLDRARIDETDAERAVATAAGAVQTAERDRARAEEAEAAARDALEAADLAVHAARHAEMATSLRAELAAGDPCPVCGQTVATIPAVSKGAGTVRAERARATAAKALAKATQAREDASATAATAAAADAGAREARDRCAAASAEAEAALRAAEATLATTKSALVDRLGEGDPEALLDERREELRVADEAVRTMADALAAARRALDAAREQASATAKALASLRERSIAAWGFLDLDHDLPLDDDVASLAAADQQIREAIARLDKESSATSAQAAKALASAGASRDALLADADLPHDADVGALANTAEVQAAGAEERRRALADAAAKGADLDARVEAGRAALATLTRLRDDLQPSRFLAWLLVEERAALAELASVHLDALTDGDFRFADDESFRIVDVSAAGTEREPDSLSGGETFLASLALALALADMVTRGGGRLDSFFLDEGFGSLDPEHIERAMTGIEHLVRDGDDRLVILVSHVTQMHELLEDLIVLEKDERVGSSRVLSGATPV